MNLNRKLLSGFGVMLALVLAFAGSALVMVNSFQGDLDRAVNLTAREQYLAGGVSTAAAEITSLARGSVLSAVVADEAHARIYQQQFGAATARLRQVLDGIGPYFAQAGTLDHAALARRAGSLTGSGPG